MHRHWRAVLLLTLIPLAANAGILSGLFDCDPQTFFIGLATVERPAPTGAACFVDPAVAYFTQALGGLSAQDWLHGIVPWWNPYTGIGMPLAAEVQNESFFLPFVLLLHFQNGWFLQRLLFQILSGVFTYAFLRGLGLRGAAATLGGALFSLNGTFTLTAGTVSGPIFFLPLLLIGIEQAHGAALAGRRMGWSLICFAVAGGIYAGFPEIAYFDDLLGGCWILLRLVQTPRPARWRLLGKTSLGAGIGLALTMPMIVPFLDYLRLGNAALHGGFLAHATLPRSAAPLQMLPLFYGAIGHFTPPSLSAPFGLMWVRIGGWFGAAPVFLALAALAPRARWRRAERYLLAGWVLLWEARCFGLPGMVTLFNMLPGIASTDAIRYAPLSMEFAVFALAAFGFDDWHRRIALSRRGLAAVLAVFLVLLGLSVIPALRYLPPWFAATPKLLPVALLSLLGAATVLIVLAHSLRTGRHRLFSWGLVVAGAVAVFLLPQLNGFRAVHVDRNGIAFLQAHAGLGRYMSIGPFGANFPAGYGVAGLNSLQLPSPESWDRFHDAQLLTPFQDALNGVPIATETSAVAAHLANFAAIGVEYIGVWPSMDTLRHDAAADPSMTPARLPALVFHSEAMNIYQLPNPAPYFAASDPGCAVTTINRQTLTTDCRKAAVLIRRELFYPGWHALVNQAETSVRPAGPVFQAIDLPPGAATIRFYYRPPGTRLSCAIALLAGLLWLGLAVAGGRRVPARSVPR